MLTPTDYKNIDGFNNLKKNNQRVFKCRLIKKCRSAITDLDFVLLHYEGLGLKVDKVIDINELKKLIEMYENLKKLQIV